MNKERISRLPRTGKRMRRIVKQLTRRRGQCFFRVLVQGGHMGLHRSYDLVLYVKAPNLILAIEAAQKLPRVKRTSRCWLQGVQQITWTGYLVGRARGKRDFYKTTYRRYPGGPRCFGRLVTGKVRPAS